MFGPTRVTLFSLLLCFSSLFAQSPPASHAQSPVATHGALQVSEGQLVGALDNQPVQLAGMSLFWSLWEGEKFYNRQVVACLARDWNATVVRAAMGVENGGYAAGEDAAEHQYNLVKTIVDAAIANGVYVIVDYHAHDAYNVEDSTNSINTAKQFFSRIAEEYANTPNIIWEIWNEPDNANGSDVDEEGNGWDSWEDIKTYAAAVIPVIREHSDNLIVVGTPSWSQHVDIAAADPIDDPNLAYALHFYAAHESHKDSLRMRAQEAVDLGAALFITEFGTTEATGDGMVDTAESKVWLDWADSNGISWVNWSIVDKAESSAALVGGVSATGGWTEEELTESGRWIRNRLLSRPSYEYNDIIPDDGISLPGLIEAESFDQKSEELTPEQTSDAGGGQNLAYTSDGAWAEYSVIVRRAGDYTAQLRVATAEGFGGTITLKFGDQTVASWEVTNTGGWQSWATSDTSQTFELEEGETTFRLEWSGEASSLVNLNWIEFNLEEEYIGVCPHGVRRRMLPKGVSIKRGIVSFTPSPDLTRVSLLSVSGRVIKDVPASRRQIRIPQSAGVYILRLYGRQGQSRTLPVYGFGK